MFTHIVSPFKVSIGILKRASTIITSISYMRHSHIVASYTLPSLRILRAIGHTGFILLLVTASVVGCLQSIGDTLVAFSIIKSCRLRVLTLVPNVHSMVSVCLWTAPIVAPIGAKLSSSFLHVLNPFWVNFQIIFHGLMTEEKLEVTETRGNNFRFGDNISQLGPVASSGRISTKHRVQDCPGWNLTQPRYLIITVAPTV
mmetsp:Transcript_441/g.682  ORF Transcript_441/g.682 Transcript_441/m.682 type:complete len:200 (+) Transcript_441:185-784(+)